MCRTAAGLEKRPRYQSSRPLNQTVCVEYLIWSTLISPYQKQQQVFVSPRAPSDQIEPLHQKDNVNLLWCPRGRERGLTEPLQISGLAKLALIPLWSFHPGQERREGLLFYSLTPQAKQRATRNWDNSTHGGSGAVILNVIFTEATREFLWATAKSQQHGGRGERSEEKRDIVLFPCDSLYFTSPEYSSFLPSLGRFFFFLSFPFF